MNDEIQKLISALDEMEDGCTTTVYRLMKDLGLHPEKKSSVDLLTETYNFFNEAKKRGYDLDMSKHDGRIEGMLYNLDFVYHKKA